LLRVAPLRRSRRRLAGGGVGLLAAGEARRARRARRVHRALGDGRAVAAGRDRRPAPGAAARLPRLGPRARSGVLRGARVAVLRVVIQMVLAIVLTVALQLAVRARLPAERRARGWNGASWGAAVYAFGPASMLGFFWVTRRP